MANISKIALQRIDNGAIVDFEVGHAENILMMRNSGWQLPNDSEFNFDTENGFTKRNTKKDSGKGKGKHDK